MLVAVFACCALKMAAQNTFKVTYQGARPTISDFAWSFLSTAIIEDEDGCVDEATSAFKQAWTRYRKGLKQREGDTLVVDQRNGYAVYESRNEERLIRWEVCYWNESDGKHKLFAYNIMCYENGRYSPGQYDGLRFYRYDNATKKMTQCEGYPGFDGVYDVAEEEQEPVYVSYDLPRTGKDIKVTWTWNDSGKTKQKMLKFDGHNFNF